MTRRAEPTAEGRVRRIAFLVSTGLASAFLVVALLAAYPLLFTNWLPGEAWLSVRPDRSPGDQVHRLHSLALAVISWGMLSGVVLQLHRPRRKVGALLMALATVLAVASGSVITGTFTVGGVAPFLVVVLLPAVLHPSAGELIRVPGVNRPMLALALLAAGPWIAYALSVGEAARLAGPGGDVDHLMFVATVALVVPLWAIIGTAAKPGWAFPAGAAVVAAGCVGLQSLVFPDALSGLEPAWAAAALVWSFAYGVASRLRSLGDRPTHALSTAA